MVVFYDATSTLSFNCTRDSAFKIRSLQSVVYSRVVYEACWRLYFDGVHPWGEGCSSRFNKAIARMGIFGSPILTKTESC